LRKGNNFIKPQNINNKNFFIINKINFINNFKNSGNPYLNLLPFSKKKLKITIPRPKRDFISENELIKIIMWEDVVVLRPNAKKFKLHLIKCYQYKLSMLLLSLSGGRISDLLTINFHNLKNLLKNDYIGLYIQKDKKHRRIFLKNDFLKKNIKKYFNLLLEKLNFFGINTTLLQAIPLFFKLKPLLIEKKLINLKKSTIINELNTFLSAACVYLNITKKIKIDDAFKNKKIQHLEVKKYITSHSFRITKISILIKRIGLYKTMLQIGHSYPNTTLLYNRNLK